MIPTRRFLPTTTRLSAMSIVDAGQAYGTKSISLIKHSHVRFQVGVGHGLLRVLCKHMEIDYRSLDSHADLKPDILGDIKDIPLPGRSVDLTCAFQVLEHLPYQDALRGFQELCRVSRRDILISLPNARKAHPFMLTLPFIKPLRILTPGPLPPLHPMIKLHRWEIGRPGTPLRKVLKDLGQVACLHKHFRIFENPYHHFFHFKIK